MLLIFQVKRTIAGFLNGNQEARHKLVERFKEINAKFSLSTFFKNHEVSHALYVEFAFYL